MSDQTPDPTAWSDDRLDNLLDALAERAAERDALDLPGGGPSRRGILAGLLSLGGAAAAGGVASAVGESENYGGASGVVGTDSEPLNEANVQNLHAQDAQIDGALEVEQLGSDRHFAGSYPGGDPDARLGNALQAASGGGVIYLENAVYDNNRSITQAVRLIGTTAGGREGTLLDATWTADTVVDFVGIFIDNGKIDIRSTLSTVESCQVSGTGTITVAANNVRLTSLINFGTITFESGTSGGVADGIVGADVTDNGINTLGDGA